MPRRHAMPIATLGLLTLLGSTANAQDALEAMMSAEQYRAAGLHKLSDDERAALENWLRERTGANLPTPATETNAIPDKAVVSTAVPATAVTVSEQGAAAPKEKTASASEAPMVQEASVDAAAAPVTTSIIMADRASICRTMPTGAAQPPISS